MKKDYRSAHWRDSRTGSTLALVLLVLLIMSVLGMGMIRLGAYSGTETAKAVSAHHAFWGAEAGLETAKAVAYRRRNVLQMDHVFPAGTPLVYTGETARASYLATVTSTTNTPPSYHVSSLAVSWGGITKVVEAEVNQVPAISIGVFGDQFLELKPNIEIYSFRSSSGILNPIPAQSTGEASAGSNVLLSMSANPNFMLDGQIMLGSDPQDTTSASLNCTGSNCEFYESGADEVGYVDPDPLGMFGNSSLADRFVTIPFANDNWKADSIVDNVMLVTGNNTTNTITTGEYYLTQGTVDPHATLIVDVSGGPVVFYLTGSLRAESRSSFLTIGGGPDSFRVYANSSSPPDEIWLQPKTDFGGFIYAPLMRVHIQPGGDFRGGIWAGQTELFPGGEVYIDMDLFEYGAFNAYRIEIANWRETPHG